MSYLEGVRTGASIVQQGFDEYDRARAWKERLAEKAEEHQEKARQLLAESKKAATAASEKKDELQEKKDEFGFEMAETVRHNKKTEENAANKAPKESPALRALKDQYKQVSSDVRSHTLGGTRTPSDLIKRYNAIGGALNAQMKHEFPDSVGADFVPMPETNAPGADGSHPAQSWLQRLTGRGAPPAPAAPTAESWRTFDR